jgi:DNA-binding transcriptional regulator YhcF (GntR family)
MKLWLSKNSEVPLQKQLCAQFVMGIVSGDLPADEQLPSSNELARRFKVHPNTVRLAYRDLAREGWIEWKQGRGFFVCDSGRLEQKDGAETLDRLIAAFFDAARRRGYSSRDIRARFTHWLSQKPPDHILVIEQDDELRKILVAEIQGTMATPVRGIRPEAFSKRRSFTGALCATLHDRARKGSIAMPAALPSVLLRSSSIAKSLAKEQRPPADVLIAVISSWNGFLDHARATLTAVGIDSAAIELRRGGAEDAKRRLAKGHLVITDSLIGQGLSPHPLLRVFRIIAGESLEELREGLGRGEI